MNKLSIKFQPYPNLLKIDSFDQKIYVTLITNTSGAYLVFTLVPFNPHIKWHSVHWFLRVIKNSTSHGNL